MHEHLVDDDLEEQRRDQGEQLQEEGGDQHFGEEAAVLVDGAEEPGDVEAAREIDEARPPCHQDEIAGPASLKLGLRHHGRERPERVLHQDLVLAYLGEEEEAAVPHDRDGRQSAFGQAAATRILPRGPAGQAPWHSAASPGPRSGGPKRWRIWAGSAPTPWKRRSMTKAVTPGSVCCDCGCETKTGMLKVRSAPGTDCGKQSKRFHGCCSPPMRSHPRRHAPVGWWLPKLLSSAVREPASAASSLKYRRANGTR